MPTRSKKAPAERGAQFTGYHRAAVPEPDEELARVGRGTPGGEYLRRFWHPVAMSSEVLDRADGGSDGVPVPVRILGEDLILFRNKRRELGLLHRHCSHRGTSLEYGKLTDRGIQCCYHGWHFATDGTILETPGLPENNKIKQTVRHGAYPVHEYRGLIFAYMGPPAEMPEFPRLEIYEYPDTDYAAHCFHFSCNWLQVHENCCDPFHATWLHTRHSGAQFVEAWSAWPVLRWRETPNGMITETTRRSGENFWFDSVDVVMPNLRCTGDLWEDGTQVKAFRRTALTLYAVPIDDTNTLFIGLRMFNKSTDMHSNGRMDLCGRETADHPGQSGLRPPAERPARAGRLGGPDGPAAHRRARARASPADRSGREFVSPTAPKGNSRGAGRRPERRHQEQPAAQAGRDDPRFPIRHPCCTFRPCQGATTKRSWTKCPGK